MLIEGTPLPKSLTILHEHSDHYSLQCTEPMSLDGVYLALSFTLHLAYAHRPALNAELTKFINEHGRQLDKEKFDEEYPFEI